LYEFALTFIVKFAFFVLFFCVFLYVIFLRFALPLIAPWRSDDEQLDRN